MSRPASPFIILVCSIILANILLGVCLVLFKVNAPVKKYRNLLPDREINYPSDGYIEDPRKVYGIVPGSHRDDLYEEGYDAGYRDADSGREHRYK